MQKTILSSADSISALKFFDMGTKAFEAEAGLTINEPGTYAVKAAVEMGVVELIKEGKAKGIWDYKQDTVPTPPAELPKVEEKKDDVKPISTTVPQKEKGEASPTADQKTTAPKAEVKQSAVMYLKHGHYVNKTHDEKSTRVWFFGPGLEVEVVEHHKDWVKIKARDGKQGFVKKDVLTSDKP